MVQWVILASRAEWQLKIIAIVGVVLARPLASSGVFAGPGPSSVAGTRLRVLSWNVAAVNNNPFEYWITHPSPEYGELMKSVEDFIVEPGDEDVRVDEVFTDAMFKRVLAEMNIAGMQELAAVESMWNGNYRSRTIVSEFLRDGVIGKKRLASMPDRVTNTIQLPSGQSAFRPTVINCYPDKLDSVDDWFEKWMHFFFSQKVDVDGKGSRPVYTLLNKIKKSKYPAVTEEEEKASVPLQVVLQGIFDAILVGLMQKKGTSTWQRLRKDICESLNSKKNERLMEILQSTYKDADVVFLQEAGNQLVKLIEEAYAGEYLIVLPKDYSQERNQNSVMLLRAGSFAGVEEVDIPVDGWDAGDLLVVKARFANVELSLASFHGDTNGLLTAPMLMQVMKHLPTERLVFGMDANTYEHKSDSTAHVLEFESLYRRLGLAACWGKVEPNRYTTYNARTYLQPQLNKATKSTELSAKGDRNPKDFVLFTRHFASGEVWRDNTGVGKYDNDIVFPTLSFPSDHAALATDMYLIDGNEEL